MRKLKVCVFVIALFFASHSAMAQCCSAGNPFFYGDQSSLDRKELQLIGGYKYSMSNQYYHEDSKVDIGFVDKVWFNYLNLQMIYGITSNLTIETDLGYFLNKTEQYKTEDWSTIKGYGLGDAQLTVRYLVYKNFEKQFSIVPSIGVKFPIGVFDQEVDHVKLPITVQPSSGSFKYLLNLYLNKSTKNHSWNFGFYASVEFAQLINSENFYYKYGNSYLFSIIASYIISPKFTIGLEARNENREKSIREKDQIVESSGYNIVYLIPHLNYNISRKWFVSVNSDIPVYRFYNGIQLSNNIAFSIRLSYSLSFVKNIYNEINTN